MPLLHRLPRGGDCRGRGENWRSRKHRGTQGRGVERARGSHSVGTAVEGLRLMLSAVTSSPTERAAAARRGRWLQYLTIAWNSAECVVALMAGFLAGSIALVGFGFDSAIEVTSGLAALWRLRRDAAEAPPEAAERP